MKLKICDDRDPSWMTTKIKELTSQKNKLYPRIKKRNNSFVNKQLLHSKMQKKGRKCKKQISFLQFLKN